MTTIRTKEKDVVFEAMIVVRFDDGAEDALFANKTLVTILNRDNYRELLKKMHLTKTMGLESVVVKWDNPIWTIDTSLEDLGKQLVHIVPEEALEAYGDVRENNPMGDFEMTIDNMGGICLEAPHKHTYGKGVSEILIQELTEVFGEIEIGTALGRNEVMEFWRSDEMSEELTTDDRLEIFTSAPIGQGDLSKEMLDGILGDYQVENIKVFDINDEVVLPSLLIAKDVATEYVKNIEERIRLYEDDDSSAAFNLEGTLRDQGAELASYVIGESCEAVQDICNISTIRTSDLSDDMVDVLLNQNADFVPTGTNKALIFNVTTLDEVVENWEPDENKFHTDKALRDIKNLQYKLKNLSAEKFLLKA